MNRKNTILLLKSLPKNNVALFFIAAMLIGLLCSRAIASMGMFFFGLNALRDVPPKQWLRQRWWLLGLVWIGFYALSGLWSADKPEWSAHLQVKLPFLLLPLAFLFLDPWTPRQLRQFTGLFAAIMIAGALYSISFMVCHPQEYIEGYKFSHTLPTPAYNDHISFSTAIAICIAWCIYSWPLWTSKLHKALVIIAIMGLVLYLHILAAKTGLVAFYVFLGCYLLYLLAASWKRAIILILVILGGFFSAYKFIPTLRERVTYTIYSYDRYKMGDRNGLYSDMGRIISYNISLQLIHEKPLTGVGAGDVLHAMGDVYRKEYPQIPQEQYLYPHNQFLTTAVAAGVPAAIALIWWMLVPVFRLLRNREGFFFIAIWLMLLVPLLVDPFLEVQAGVFVYLFFFLMQRSLLIPPERIRTLLSAVPA